MDRPAESVEYHTRLLRCSLEVDHSREYWQHVEQSAADSAAHVAFSEYWFGARSLPRVRVLLANFRERFDRFSPALAVLNRWRPMDATTRRQICHWHLQLADRLYREFTGDFLVSRLAVGRSDVSRDVVVRWTEERAPQRWTISTRIQFARKLLFSAEEAGILKHGRDPRQIEMPRVNDDALAYLLYLLRGLQFQGTLITNPYLASVGIDALELDRRLRGGRDCSLSRQGELFEFSWRYENLTQWAQATVPHADNQLRGTA